MLLSILLAAAPLVSPAEARSKRYKDFSSVDIKALENRLIKNPPYLSAARMPKGVHIGRCLLVIDGQTRISGPCSYSIEKGGDFSMAGPRQVYDGIDYPKAGDMAAMISTDWWASLFRQDGVWSGYSNEIIGSVHGQESRWGELKRQGACYTNEHIPGRHQRVRVCLWNK